MLGKLERLHEKRGVFLMYEEQNLGIKFLSWKSNRLLTHQTYDKILSIIKCVRG